eukprot:1012356-Rhodomonas_salina.2
MACHFQLCDLSKTIGNLGPRWWWYCVQFGEGGEVWDEVRMGMEKGSRENVHSPQNSTFCHLNAHVRREGGGCK